jgi:hypothetical protein
MLTVHSMYTIYVIVDKMYERLFNDMDIFSHIKYKGNLKIMMIFFWGEKYIEQKLLKTSTVMLLVCGNGNKVYFS